MISNSDMFVLIGIGLGYLALLFAILGLGLWLMVRRPALRWLGGLLVLGVLSWSFGPWALGHFRLQLARAPVEALQLRPDELPLRDARVVIVTMQGGVDCLGFCFDLLDSGVVASVHFVEAHDEVDFDRLAADPLGALVDDRATLWTVTLGTRDADFGNFQLPEMKMMPWTGEIEADLVMLDDNDGLITRHGWGVLIPEQPDPTAGQGHLHLLNGLHIWQGWPEADMIGAPLARTVRVEVAMPSALLWFAGGDWAYLPSFVRSDRWQDWLCRAGDQRRELC